MQIVANFSYAGTQKYVSHAVENGRTLCGMSVDELLSRVGQEWDYISEICCRVPKELKHPATEVGCVKCLRLLTKRAADGAYCECESPDLYSDGGADIWCRTCGNPPRSLLISRPLASGAMS